MRIILFLFILSLSEPCFSQTLYSGAVNSVAQTQQKSTQEKKNDNFVSESKFKGSERSENLKNEINNMKGSIGNSQDAIKARNLLLLKEVLDFKMQDESLVSEIEKLKQNREFNTKLLRALNQLDNQKNSDKKNKEVINILNDAGNRIYNSLLN